MGSGLLTQNTLKKTKALACLGLGLEGCLLVGHGFLKESNIRVYRHHITSTGKGIG